MNAPLISLNARALVAVALDQFLDMANNHPGKPEAYHFIAEPSGRNYRVILCHTERDDKDRSVHCFVGQDTGDVFKAAGWKAPAKGVRYNLCTEGDEVARVFDWAGGYLYAGARAARGVR